MAGADSDGQGIDARAGYKFFDFFRTGIVSFMSSDFDIIFDAGQLAQFAFDDDAVSVCIFNDFFRDGDIVFERMFRAVDHDGSETAVESQRRGRGEGRWGDHDLPKLLLRDVSNTAV